MTDAREFPSQPLVGVGIAVLRIAPLSVLLVRRARAPAAGSWSLPGGAQRLGESAAAAVRRELAEETGLSVGALHLAGYVDSIHPHRDGRVQYHYTILDFCAWWAGGQAVAGDDAAAVAWAKLDRLGDYALWDEAVRIIGLSRAILAADRPPGS